MFIRAYGTRFLHPGLRGPLLFLRISCIRLQTPENIDFGRSCYSHPSYIYYCEPCTFDRAVNFVRDCGTHVCGKPHESRQQGEGHVRSGRRGQIPPVQVLPCAHDTNRGVSCFPLPPASPCDGTRLSVIFKAPPVYLYIITLASPAATPVSHTVVPHPPLLIHYTFPCPTLRPTLYYYYITVTNHGTLTNTSPPRLSSGFPHPCSVLPVVCHCY